MKALGAVEFDYLHLADHDLRSCRGCFTCFVRGEEH
jgi:multimeric flavodoxin WrbA